MKTTLMVAEWIKIKENSGEIASAASVCRVCFLLISSTILNSV